MMPIEDLQMSTVLPKISISRSNQMKRSERGVLAIPRGTLKLCLKRLRLDSFADGFCENDPRFDWSRSPSKML